MVIRMTMRIQEFYKGIFPLRVVGIAEYSRKAQRLGEGLAYWCPSGFIQFQGNPICNKLNIRGMKNNNIGQYLAIYPGMER